MDFKIWDNKAVLDVESKTLKVWDHEYIANVRYLSDMDNMFEEDKNVPKNTELYLMFREVSANDLDLETFRKHNMRYDITVKLPVKVSWEFNKTHGHYHPKKGNWVRYSEVYEVLKGQAIYLMQDEKDYFYKAVPENNAFEMKHYGHVTINPLSEPLVMANIVSCDFTSEYGDYKENDGAFIYLKEKEGQIVGELNPKYSKNLNKIESYWFFEREGDIYKDYLNHTQKYIDILS